MNASFTLDTSGYVTIIKGANNVATQYPWRALDALTQGYVEAMFASLATPPFTDHPHLQREGVCYGETIVGFSDLAPETLARIIADCAALQAGSPEGDDEDGGHAWKVRQAGRWPDFPPLTPTLRDDGKVYLAEVQS